MNLIILFCQVLDHVYGSVTLGQTNINGQLFVLCSVVVLQIRFILGDVNS